MANIKKNSFPCQISAKSQSWADELSSTGFSMMESSGKSPHSTRDSEGLYNSENIGESPTVASSVKMYYDEIKDYDFNNPGQKSLVQGQKIVGKLFLFI